MDSGSNLTQLAAGAIAGGCGRIAAAPFDVIKIRIQLQGSSKMRKYSGLFPSLSTVFHEEGIWGLWRGNVPAIGLSIVYSAVQFPCYSYFLRNPEMSSQSDLKKQFLSGGLAGVVATLISYPIELIRTQMASQSHKMGYHRALDSVLHNYSSFGLKGFYIGIGPALVHIFPYMGINFLLYSRFDAFLRNHTLFSPIEVSFPMISGGLSGALSKLAVYPLDTIKKRMQVQANRETLLNYASVSRHSSSFSCFLSILSNEGFSSFYRGFVPTIAKSATSTAVTFFVYNYFISMANK